MHTLNLTSKIGRVSIVSAVAITTGAMLTLSEFVAAKVARREFSGNQVGFRMEQLRRDEQFARLSCEALKAGNACSQERLDLEGQYDTFVISTSLSNYQANQFFRMLEELVSHERAGCGRPDIFEEKIGVAFGAEVLAGWKEFKNRVSRRRYLDDPLLRSVDT